MTRTGDDIDIPYLHWLHQAGVPFKHCTNRASYLQQTSFITKRSQRLQLQHAGRDIVHRVDQGSARSTDNGHMTTEISRNDRWPLWHYQAVHGIYRQSAQRKNLGNGKRRMKECGAISIYRTETSSLFRESCRSSVQGDPHFCSTLADAEPRLWTLHNHHLGPGKTKLCHVLARVVWPEAKNIQASLAT